MDIIRSRIRAQAPEVLRWEQGRSPVDWAIVARDMKQAQEADAAACALEGAVGLSNAEQRRATITTLSK